MRAGVRRVVRPYRTQARSPCHWRAINPGDQGSVTVTTGQPDPQVSARDGHPRYTFQAGHEGSIPFARSDCSRPGQGHDHRFLSGVDLPESDMGSEAARANPVTGRGAHRDLRCPSRSTRIETDIEGIVVGADASRLGSAQRHGEFGVRPGSRLGRVEDQHAAHAPRPAGDAAPTSRRTGRRWRFRPGSRHPPCRGRRGGRMPPDVRPAVRSVRSGNLAAISSVWSSGTGQHRFDRGVAVSRSTSPWSIVKGAPAIPSIRGRPD